MSEAPFHSIPESSQVKEYQDALLQALKVAHSYDGTESSYENVSEEFIAFEEKIRSFNLVPEGSIQDQEVRAFEQFLHRDHRIGEPPNISTLLDIAATSEGINRAIHASLVSETGTRETAEDLPLFVRRINGIILPPDNHPTLQQGEGVFEPARFQERLLELTQLLLREEVFLDDYIVSIGTLSPSQMREVSYAVVEIPRINRTVLVCDQIGEATFVIHGIGDPKRFLSFTKDELQESLGPAVKRIVRHSDQQWHSDLGIFLFTEDAWGEYKEKYGEGLGERSQGKRQKFDVRKMTEIRDAILESEFNTPEKWVKMSQKQANAFYLPLFGDIHLNAMCRPFGIEGNPISSTLLRLQFGRRIFGDDPIIMNAIENQTITIEKIRVAVLKSEFNTPERWIRMNAKQAAVFHLPVGNLSTGGIGFTAIAVCCGIEGSPMSNTLVHLKIGAILFYNDPNIIKAIENQSTTIEDIQDAVSQSEFNTPTKWINMKQKEASAFKLPSLGNIGFRKIASIVGIKSDINLKIHQLEVGREIFNNSQEILLAIKNLASKNEALKDITREKVIDAILHSEYANPAVLLNMTIAELSRVKLEPLGGIGLKAIVHHCGIPGDPFAERERCY